MSKGKSRGAGWKATVSKALAHLKDDRDTFKHEIKEDKELAKSLKVVKAPKRSAKKKAPAKKSMSKRK